MSAGFVRRYTSNPGIETLGLIEGVVIFDMPPPGVLAASGVGTVGVIGEFADMAYATAVSGGAVTTSITPVEVYSPQDMLDKVGGFDATIGDTGISGGNGFIAIRNKKFSRLVVAPVNLCSAYAVRLYRDLPTNKSATDPTPTVPVIAASVDAGREFKRSGARVHVGTRVTFTQTGAYAQGVDGAVTAAGSPAATQTFGSAGATFLTSGVVAGDLIVIGVIGAAGAQGANAGIYRVNTTPVGETSVVLEKRDGSTFDWTSGTALAWRIHPALDGESGAGNAAAVAACTIPARPIDSTIANSLLVTPTVVPTAATASSCDPLSGLTMRTHPSESLTYSAATQAPNAVSAAAIDALYTAAFDAMLSEDLPCRDVNIIIPARTSATIRAYQKAHVLAASSQGVGRITIINPEINQATFATVIGSASPGVGATRDERVIYTYPGAQTFVPEAVGYSMVTSNGTTTDGVLDTPVNAWLASVLSILAPERNPGEATPTVASVMANVLGLSRLHVNTLTMNSYIALKRAGICALRIDKTSGAIFQSGITSSLTAGLKNINRRRMADFIEDNLATILGPFSKQPLTESLKDAELGEVDTFLSNLKSVTNAAAQRIVDYMVDDVSGNTPDLTEAGIHVIIVKVRSLSTQDVVVIQAEVGEGVVTTTSN